MASRGPGPYTVGGMPELISRLRWLAMIQGAPGKRTMSSALVGPSTNVGLEVSNDVTCSPLKSAETRYGIVTAAITPATPTRTARRDVWWADSTWIVIK